MKKQEQEKRRQELTTEIEKAKNELRRIIGAVGSMESTLSDTIAELINSQHSGSEHILGINAFVALERLEEVQCLANRNRFEKAQSKLELALLQFKKVRSLLDK